jgi:plastocyanin
MRLRQLAGFAFIVAVLACGGDGGVTTPGGTNGTVRGTVTDNQGANVVSANVALSRAGTATRTIGTVGDGSYTFANVAAGNYNISVTPPVGFSLGAGGGTTTVTVVAGQQANVAAIVLNRNAPGVPPNFVAISMANTSFVPQSVELAVGGTVRFTNNDNQVHNATGTGLATGNMNSGQIVERVLSTAGTINYDCTLHAGMSGTIVVR